MLTLPSRFRRDTFLRPSPPVLENNSEEQNSLSPDLTSAQARDFEQGPLLTLGTAAALGLSLFCGARHARGSETIDLSSPDKLRLQYRETGVFRENESGRLVPNLDEPKTPEEKTAFQRALKQAEIPNRILKSLELEMNYLKSFDNAPQDLHSETGQVAVHSNHDQRERARLLQFDTGSGQVTKFSSEETSTDGERAFQASRSFDTESSRYFHQLHRAENGSQSSVVEMSLTRQPDGLVHYLYQETPDGPGQHQDQEKASEPSAVAYRLQPNGTLRPDLPNPATLEEVRVHGLHKSAAAEPNRLLRSLNQEIDQVRTFDNTERDLNSTLGVVETVQDYGSYIVTRQLSFEPGEMKSRHYQTTVRHTHTENNSRTSHSYRPGPDLSLLSKWERSSQNQHATFRIETDAEGRIRFSTSSSANR